MSQNSFFFTYKINIIDPLHGYHNMLHGIFLKIMV